MRTKLAGVSVSITVIAAAGLGLVPPAGAAGLGPCTPHADYDGDGYGDLAMGVPKRDIGGKGNAGAVVVVLGHFHGISRHDQHWDQDKGGLRGDGAQRADVFGAALTSGDFDKDGFTDLAVGVPGEDGGRGMVHEIRGGGDEGLTGQGDRTHDLADWAGLTPEAGDRFGQALVSGDFDGDGFADLAIAAPKATVSGQEKAGRISVVYGSWTGLTGTRQKLRQEDLGFTSEANDRFGETMTVCDFDGDGYDDLAIGIGREDLSGKADAGEVAVVYGSGTGLDAGTAQSFDASDTAGGTTARERFGTALAAGDIDGDGNGDLIIGLPRATVAGKDEAGRIDILYGSGTGLTSAGSDSHDQAYFSGTPEAGDRFGFSVASGDFNVDGYADVGIGVPNEDRGGVNNAGVVHVAFGSGSGLSSNAETVRQGIGGVAGGDERGDKFGYALRAADMGGRKFGGTRVQDLAIGTPFEDDGSKRDAGVVHVVFGSGGLSLPSPERLGYGLEGISKRSARGDRFGATLA